MRIFLILFLIFVNLFVPILCCASGELKYFKEINHTHIFCIGQQASLEKIMDNIPALKQKTLIVQDKFNQNFKLSFEEIEKILKLLYKGKWREHLKQLATIESKINSAQITEEQAMVFLNLVESRATGDIETPVIQTLLSFHPTFNKYPEQEFLMGYKNIYETKNHPKARGLDIRIEYPKSWTRREGKRPHIVQFFRSKNGHGIVMMSLIIKSFQEAGLNLPKNVIKNLFNTKKGIESLVPKNWKILESKPIVLDNQKGALLIVEINKQRMDINQTIISHQYITIYNNNYINFNVGVKDKTENYKALQKAYNKHKKLFWLIANSLIIQNQYF